VGDVAGHGRGAINAMLRLYHGLAALAMTGATPGRLLDWLNDLVQAAGLENTASVFAGYYCPGTRTLSWAQAGHPPPALIRGGSLLQLRRPTGVLLGAPSSGYETRTTTLRAGDLVLLYTDGLLERRDAAQEASTAAVLGAAGGYADPDEAATAVLSAAGANPADDTCLLVLQIR
jgi:serine phosphatase RsbU (regulator of sigma subunit)